MVLSRLPATPDRKPSVRVTADPPCGACEVAPLRYDAPRRRWWCPSCRQIYDREALADLLSGHVTDGELAARDRDRRARQVRGGAPGAAIILHRAAADGAAVSRAALFKAATGPERRALLWALRGHGNCPLSAERCREAAAELSTLTRDLAGE